MLKGKFAFALSTALVAALVLQGLAPAGQAFGRDQDPRNRGEVGSKGQRPDLDPEEAAEIEGFAQLVARTLVYHENGKVSVNWEQAPQLSHKQRRQLRRAAEDINEGHIGVAIRRGGQSPQVYGNPAALEQDSSGQETSPGTAKEKVETNVSTWTDGYGFAIYLDPWFSQRVKNFDSAAIGTILGILTAYACGTGVGCIAVGVLVAWFWDEVWEWYDQRYFADSLIIHAPKWGWVYIQPFKSGAWFDGRWFRTWLWT